MDGESRKMMESIVHSLCLYLCVKKEKVLFFNKKVIIFFIFNILIDHILLKLVFLHSYFPCGLIVSILRITNDLLCIYYFIDSNSLFDVFIYHILWTMLSSLGYIYNQNYVFLSLFLILLLIIVYYLKIIPPYYEMTIRQKQYIYISIIPCLCFFIFKEMIYVLNIEDLKMVAFVLLLVLEMIYFLSLKTVSQLNISYNKQQEIEYMEKNIQIYIQQYQQDNETIMKIKHDLRQHLQILEQTQYQSSYYDEIVNHLTISHNQTGNIYLDSCLSLKQKEYPNIHFITDIYIDALQMNNYDLCSLIFNLLDNAAKEAQKTNQIVQFYLKQDHHQLYIKVENEVQMKPQIIFQPKDGHGYGLLIIQDIVKKYEGDLSLDYQNNKFSVYIHMFV